MIKEKQILRPLKWIFQRAFILYVTGFLAFYAMVNYRDVMDKAKVAAINRLMPSIDGLVGFITHEKPLTDSYLREWVMYYRAVGEVSPARADVHGMLGFCYYYLGRTDKAIKHFKDATIHNPHFFWYYYNLAVIFFEQGNYREALDYIHLAIDTSREATVAFLPLSKPYTDLIQPIDPQLNLLNNHYEEARAQAFKMLILSHYYLKEFPQVLSLAPTVMKTVNRDQDFYNFYLGLAAMELKQYPFALRYLEESIHKNDQYAEPFYFYSVASKVMGKGTMANQAMSAAMRLRQAGAPDRPLIDGLKVKIF